MNNKKYSVIILTKASRTKKYLNKSESKSINFELSLELYLKVPPKNRNKRSKISHAVTINLDRDLRITINNISFFHFCVWKYNKYTQLSPDRLITGWSWVFVIVNVVGALVCTCCADEEENYCCLFDW